MWTSIAKSSDARGNRRVKSPNSNQERRNKINLRNLSWFQNTLDGYKNLKSGIYNLQFIPYLCRPNFRTFHQRWEVVFSLGMIITRFSAGIL